jgi:hypothetical protein
MFTDNIADGVAVVLSIPSSGVFLPGSTDLASFVYDPNETRFNAAILDVEGNSYAWASNGPINVSEPASIAMLIVGIMSITLTWIWVHRRAKISIQRTS